MLDFKDLSLEIKTLIFRSDDALTLADRRFYNCLLGQAYSRLEQEQMFALCIKDFDNVYGYGEATLEDIKCSLKKLSRAYIEFEAIGVAHSSWCIAPLFDQVRFCDTQQILYYSFSATCRKLLLIPECFEKHIIQAHFMHKYSSTFYSILSAPYFKNKLTYQIEVKQLRLLLGISGSKFSNFNDLKRYVLEPSLREINAHASFTVVFKQINKGRKISNLDFIFQPKADEYKHFHSQQSVSSKLEQLLTNNPQLLKAYNYLVNAKTEEREHFFNLASKFGLVKGLVFRDEEVDNPELWFELISDKILDKFKTNS